MSSQRVVTTVWTCDACGYKATVSDEQKFPPGASGWRQIVIATLPTQLGNVPTKHLCDGCAGEVESVLTPRAEA